MKCRCPKKYPKTRTEPIMWPPKGTYGSEAIGFQVWLGHTGRCSLADTVIQRYVPDVKKESSPE